MNVLMPQQPPPRFPHHRENVRLTPPRSASPYPNMSGRKRKSDEDGDEMVVSPQRSPALHPRQLLRVSKKMRTSEALGRPLALPRLLETLDNDQLRMVLQKIGERHPTIGQEVVVEAPRPTVAAVLDVLHSYQVKLNAAVPYGETSAEYTYHRVKQPLVALIEAVSDFTPHFLPPIEAQATISLQYLDGATKLIHSLPDWQPQSYRHHKETAYDEISRAWAIVIREATKRGGGFHMYTGGWDKTIANHNRLSGGSLSVAMDAMAAGLSWMISNPTPVSTGSDPNSRFDQLMAGTLGPAVRVGHY